MGRMNAQQRRDALGKMSPEKQLDIYLAASGEEPGHNFSYDVANNWRSILPALKLRLNSQPGEAERIQLLWLLASISENYCSLTERNDVLKVASEVVDQMGESNRRYAEEPLRRITHPTKQLPPCR